MFSLACCLRIDRSIFTVPILTCGILDISLPLPSLGSDIKVGIVDFIKIVGGALTFGLLAISILIIQKTWFVIVSSFATAATEETSFSSSFL
jgi:hypothetical protein